MPKRKTRRAPSQAPASRKKHPEASQKLDQETPHHETPNQETEVKLRVADRQVLLRQLASLRAIYQGRVHEMNTLYDTRGGALRRKGQLVRIRVERPADRAEYRTSRAAKRSPAPRETHPALLTYKGPLPPALPGRPRGGPRYKIREEREVRVADEAILASILAAAGLRPSFRYEKYRATYRLPRLPGVVIEFDETPIGDFLELEGNCAAIDRSAILLGYQPSDYITKSYGHLFLEAARKSKPAKSSKRRRTRRVNSRDMLFPTKTTKK
jgi:adenylate cyclase class IV